MKRLLSLILILALALPVFTDALELTKPWNESTVSAGAEISNSGSFQNLDQRLLFEPLTGDTVDASLVTVTQSAGTLTHAQPLGIYKHRNPTSGDISGFYYNVSLDETAGPFRIETIMKMLNIDGASFRPWNMTLETTVPGTSVDGLRFIIVWRSLTTISLVYVDDVSADFAWDGGAWNADGAQTIAVPADEALIICFISNTTSWKYRVEDDEGTLIAETDSVDWADTLAQGGKDPYLVMLQQGTTTQTGDNDTNNIQIWPTEAPTTFLTSAQTVETNAITFDEDFNSDDVTVLLGNSPSGATEFKLYVKEDAGAFGAAININSTTASSTGWWSFAPGTAFTNHTSATFKVELNSPSSDTQLEVRALKVLGVTIAGGGGQQGIMGGMGL